MHGATGLGDPGGKRIAHRVRPGETRQQGGVGIDDAPAEFGDKFRCQDPHEASTHHQIRIVLRYRVQYRTVPVGARRKTRRVDGKYRDPAVGGSNQRTRVATIGSHRNYELPKW